MFWLCTIFLSKESRTHICLHFMVVTFCIFTAHKKCEYVACCMQNITLRTGTVKPELKNHLRIATTSLQRPPFCSSIWNIYYIDDLWTTTTCQQRPLFLGPEGGRCTQVWLNIHKTRSEKVKITHSYGF